jgi:GntR family transcriptional regulator/MocR family aminotransferase
MYDLKQRERIATPSLDARLLSISLDTGSDLPLYRQLHQSVRGAILEGRLRPGSRLPSTRVLATELEVSRNTVLLAYQQLEAEGYLEGRVGAGTWVASNLAVRRRAAREGDRSPRGACDLPVSRRCRALVDVPQPIAALTDGGLAFAPSMPALDEFPWRTWTRLAKRHAANQRHVLRSGLDPAGYRPLREAIATYLGAARGVNCSADQIVIVHGAQQGLDLVARTLLEPGDAVCIEDPGYPGARGAFLAAGANLVGVPVDADGLDVGLLDRLAADPRVIYVSPSHQFPLGMTLSSPRRHSLLRWASRHSAWIVEDDYDSEFRYSGQPPTALCGLDADGRVIYIGTFSKTLLPTLRSGYLVLPEALIEPFLRARVHADLFPPLLEQLMLADFIVEGHLARHVHRMRKLYRQRRDCLLAESRAPLAGLLELVPDETGLRLVGWLPRETDDRVAARAAGSTTRTGVELRGKRRGRDPPRRSPTG